MFERYYKQLDTIDRLRSSWIGEPIEQYIRWLDEQGYSARTAEFLSYGGLANLLSSMAPANGTICPSMLSHLLMPGSMNTVSITSVCPGGQAIRCGRLSSRCLS